MVASPSASLGLALFAGYAVLRELAGGGLLERVHRPHSTPVPIPLSWAATLSQYVYVGKVVCVTLLVGIVLGGCLVVRLRRYFGAGELVQVNVASSVNIDASGRAALPPARHPRRGGRGILEGGRARPADPGVARGR